MQRTLHCRHCKREIKQSDALVGNHKHVLAKIADGKRDRVVLVCLRGQIVRSW